MPHAPKRPRQQGSLPGRWVEAVFVGALGFHFLQFSWLYVRSQGAKRPAGATLSIATQCGGLGGVFRAVR
ncbi:hypothetical protein [Vreelandella andesensis]|uniref:hypothetical protein n=1 Tax=Vreelandella andesensis TaxID=447567 RepID=UPI00142D4699|nr:hypothetical protein [Halomonas andesensis]